MALTVKALTGRVVRSLAVDVFVELDEELRVVLVLLRRLQILAVHPDRQTDGRTDVIPSALNRPGHVRRKGNTEAVSPRRDEGIAVLVKLVCQQALRDWWREQRVRSPQGSKATWIHHWMQMARCFSAEMLNI